MIFGRKKRREQEQWSELDKMDAELIYTVFGREAVLKRTLDGALYYDNASISAQLVPSLQPGQSLDLREIRWKLKKNIYERKFG